MSNNTLVDTLQQLGPSRLGIMGGILVGLVMFFIFVSLRISSPDMELLYKDLATNDASAIAGVLEENEIVYEVSPDGSRIVVPQNDVGRARMLLAQSGLPNGASLGYEIFDKQSGFGTTNFVQNINQVRALEGELARTISSVENIKNARVHLVLPQRELFSRETRPSSASVFLNMYSGASISRENIASIQSLVAAGVPDLKASAVAIIDNNGNLLARGEGSDVNLFSAKAEEMRRSHEIQLTQKVEDQVSRIVGYGNVRATVTTEMNFDRISTNEELFDPETVVRSSQTIQQNETERESQSGDVSVENNLPALGAGLLDGDTPSLETSRTEEVTNFEISRTVRNTVREVGEINKLSVAVLVDGRYTEDEEGNKTYEPRTQDELDQIAALVRSAVGFDEDRGDTIEVVNMQFAQVDTDEEFVDQSMIFGVKKSEIFDLAELFLVAIMIVLIVTLILRPIINRVLETPAIEREENIEADLLAAAPASPALAPPPASDDIPLGAGMAQQDEPEESLINISGVEGKVKASSLKKVEEIIDNYPNEAVAVIRSWMTAGE